MTQHEEQISSELQLALDDLADRVRGVPAARHFSELACKSY